MKLDAKAIRYLTSEDFKVLAAVLIGPSSFEYPAMSIFIDDAHMFCTNLRDTIRLKPEVVTMRSFLRR